MSFSYEGAAFPDGLAQAFILGEEFTDGEPCALVLVITSSTATVWAGHSRAATVEHGATVFGYYVDDPER